VWASRSGAGLDSVGEVKVSIAAAKTWALLLYIALMADMSGTMARGFGWS